MSTEKTQDSDSVASHCFTAIELAIRVVKQWDKHDKFRVTEAEKALWDGDEPNDVAIARALIESDKAYGCELAEITWQVQNSQMPHGPPDEIKELHDLRVKYKGRLCELRQCEEDRDAAWKEVDRMRGLIREVIAGNLCVTELQESM